MCRPKDKNQRAKMHLLLKLQVIFNNVLVIYLQEQPKVLHFTDWFWVTKIEFSIINTHVFRIMTHLLRSGSKSPQSLLDSEVCFLAICLYSFVLSLSEKKYLAKVFNTLKTDSECNTVAIGDLFLAFFTGTPRCQRNSRCTRYCRRERICWWPWRWRRTWKTGWQNRC